jgi:hypothetical protein
VLTVKVMSPGGAKVHCGLSVGFNPKQQASRYLEWTKMFSLNPVSRLRDEPEREDGISLRAYLPSGSAA